MLLVAWLSLTPEPIDAGTVQDVKVGHFIAYAVLMLWFAQMVRPGRGRLAVAGALMVLGIGIEYLQGMTGYRTFAYGDMVDNAIGVAMGLFLAHTPLGGMLMAVERRLGATPA